MITKPNINELVTGLIRNIEQMAGRASTSDLTLLFTPVLTVLDRVGNEWASWPALLAADNDDIRATLGRLGMKLEAPEDTASSLASCNAAQAVEQLEQENRTLKNALMDAIETLDLPAGEHATQVQKSADREILALLRRMLYREDQVDVSPSRVAPTSGNPAGSTMSRDVLSSVLTRFIVEQLPGAEGVTLTNLKPLAGGASREAWIFDVSWRKKGEAHFEECILMREPHSSVLVSDESPTVINGTRRTVATEMAVIRAAAAAGLPVAHVLWTDTAGVWLERPFSISRRLPGTADTAPLVGTALGAKVLEQFIQIMSRMHKLDPRAGGFDVLGRPSAQSAAIDQVRQFERNFQAQRLEAFPATTYMIRWLTKHQPVAARVSLVHGDYRLGNFLYDERGIVAILDWEQAHIGDPLEEIAFMYWNVWALTPMCPIEEFVRRYEAAMDCTVDRKTLAYYRVFIEFKMLVVLFTSLKSYFSTPEYALHYCSAPKMIREAQLRVVEELLRGGPTVAFDAYEQGDAGHG